MALTIKSKVKDLLANDEAYAIIQKYMPLMDRDDPRLAEAMNMSMLALLAFPATGCPKETREAIAEELEDADLD